MINLTLRFILSMTFCLFLGYILGIVVERINDLQDHVLLPGLSVPESVALLSGLGGIGAFFYYKFSGSERSKE